MGFNSSKLPNGLNLVTYKMPNLRSVSVNIVIKIGSRYENSNESGAAHFLEHMAFKGTTSRSSLQIAKEFDSIGGNFNAYTSREHTVFYAKMLDEHLESAMNIIADLLQNSTYENDEIKKEFDVITQEIAETYDNPDDLAYEKFYATAFKDQVLGKSILGSIDIIKNFDQDFFHKYTSKYYTADNIVISLAGNIDHQEAENMIARLFNFLPKKKVNTAYSPAKYTGGDFILEKDLEQTTIALGFESFSYNKLEQLYQAQTLSLMLGNGLSSRLFQKIREDLGLVYTIGSFSCAFSDTGLFSIYLSCSHDKVEKAMSSIFDELYNIQLNITEEELERAKKQIKSNIYMSEEKSECKSEEIGKNYSLFNKYFSAKDVLDIVLKSSINDLKNTAVKIFSSTPTISIVGKPNKDINYDIIKQKLK